MDKIAKCLMDFKPINNRCDPACGCTKQLAVKLTQYKHTPIHFVLPAFPAKSANRNKTLSELPDKGEVMAMQQLNCLIETVNQHHPLGATLTICSDGHVFNDIVGVSDRHVSSYQEKLKQIVNDLKIRNIAFFELADHFPDMELATMRQLLDSTFSQSIAQIKDQVKTNAEERQLFNGLHRFISDDISYLHPTLSKNKLKELAKHKTYQTIARSHAWSTLIASHFDNAFRLSIHPYPCHSDKFSIALIKGQTHSATPWHNVVLKTKQGWSLVKKHLAEQLGATLVYENGAPSFYQHGAMSL